MIGLATLLYIHMGKTIYIYIYGVSILWLISAYASMFASISTVIFTVHVSSFIYVLGCLYARITGWWLSRWATHLKNNRLEIMFPSVGVEEIDKTTNRVTCNTYKYTTITQRRRVLPRHQHRECRAVEYMIGEIAENTAYTQCFHV